MKPNTADLLRRTESLLRAAPLPGLIAAIVLIATSTIKVIGSVDSILLYWLPILVGIPCNFLVLTMITRQVGVMRPGNMALRLLHFLILWAITAPTILIGFFLLILPGLYLWVRCAIVEPLAVAEGRTFIGALRESWRRTRGIAAPVLVAILVADAGFIAGTALNFSFIGTDGGPPLPALLMASWLSYLSVVLLWYLSVAIYDLTRPDGAELERVFT